MSDPTYALIEAATMAREHRMTATSAAMISGASAPEAIAGDDRWIGCLLPTWNVRARTGLCHE